MPDTPTAQPDGIIPFDEWLPKHRHGGCLAEITEKMAEVAEAVMDTQKAGTITLKITLAPLGKGNKRTVIVSDDVKAKVPEHDRDESMFYIGDRGQLLRDDPDQLAMDFREPAEPERPVREVDDKSRAAGEREDDR